MGDLRVVTLRCLVGRRTGPFTASCLERARSMSSWQTFSSDATLRDVKVMRILWVFWQQTLAQGKVGLGEQEGVLLGMMYRLLAEILFGLLERHDEAESRARCRMPIKT